MSSAPVTGHVERDPQAIADDVEHGDWRHRARVGVPPFGDPLGGHVEDDVGWRLDPLEAVAPPARGPRTPHGKVGEEVDRLAVAPALRQLEARQSDRLARDGLPGLRLDAGPPADTRRDGRGDGPVLVEHRRVHGAGVVVELAGHHDGPTASDLLAREQRIDLGGQGDVVAPQLDRGRAHRGDERSAGAHERGEKTHPGQRDHPQIGQHDGAVLGVMAADAAVSDSRRSVVEQLGREDVELAKVRGQHIGDVVQAAVGQLGADPRVLDWVEEGDFRNRVTAGERVAGPADVVVEVGLIDIGRRLGAV